MSVTHHHQNPLECIMHIVSIKITLLQLNDSIITTGSVHDAWRLCVCITVCHTSSCFIPVCATPWMKSHTCVYSFSFLMLLALRSVVQSLLSTSFDFLKTSGFTSKGFHVNMFVCRSVLGCCVVSRFILWDGAQFRDVISTAAASEAVGLYNSISTGRYHLQ
jgi:hypothetical protein